jgi:hypothetical protein
MTKPDDAISYTTGISTDNGKVLNPKTEASITKWKKDECYELVRTDI